MKFKFKVGERVRIVDTNLSGYVLAKIKAQSFPATSRTHNYGPRYLVGFDTDVVSKTVAFSGGTNQICVAEYMLEYEDYENPKD